MLLILLCIVLPTAYRVMQLFLLLLLLLSTNILNLPAGGHKFNAIVDTTWHLFAYMLIRMHDDIMQFLRVDFSNRSFTVWTSCLCKEALEKLKN